MSSTCYNRNTKSGDTTNTEKVELYTLDIRAVVDQSPFYRANSSTGVAPSSVVSTRTLSIIGQLFNLRNATFCIIPLAFSMQLFKAANH